MKQSSILIFLLLLVVSEEISITFSKNKVIQSDDINKDKKASKNSFLKVDEKTLSPDDFEKFAMFGDIDELEVNKPPVTESIDKNSKVNSKPIESNPIKNETTTKTENIPQDIKSNQTQNSSLTTTNSQTSNSINSKIETKKIETLDDLIGDESTGSSSDSNLQDNKNSRNNKNLAKQTTTEIAIEKPVKPEKIINENANTKKEPLISKLSSNGFDELDELISNSSNSTKENDKSIIPQEQNPNSLSNKIKDKPSDDVKVNTSDSISSVEKPDNKVQNFRFKSFNESQKSPDIDQKQTKIPIKESNKDHQSQSKSLNENNREATNNYQDLKNHNTAIPQIRQFHDDTQNNEDRYYDSTPATQREQQSSINSAFYQNDSNYHRIAQVESSKLKKYFNPPEFDISSLKQLDTVISDLTLKLQKKTYESDSLSETNKKLESNYESLNNQLQIQQAKLESVTEELNLINQIKVSYLTQTDKLKDGSNTIEDLQSYYARLNEDLATKIEKITGHLKRIESESASADKERVLLEESLKTKQKKLSDVEHSYSDVEKSKNNVLDEIKKTYQDLDNEQIKLLKLMAEEHEIQLEIKAEEKDDVRLALEIETIKNQNMEELKKNEELNILIQKTKSVNDFLATEVKDLEEKMKTLDQENHQKELQYEMKKDQIMNKLSSLKQDLSKEEGNYIKDKEKYTKIENDLKSKISYVSLQSNNLLSNAMDTPTPNLKSRSNEPQRHSTEEYRFKSTTDQQLHESQKQNETIKKEQESQTKQQQSKTDLSDSDLVKALSNINTADDEDIKSEIFKIMRKFNE